MRLEKIKKSLKLEIKKTTNRKGAFYADSEIMNKIIDKIVNEVKLKQIWDESETFR